ncbi:probable disease resistance protein At4g19060 [Cynara cardunculus var. scolymus]|uniref:probable disease resistance protein At4g19060 n=1 Tax=Cynara cardunculus var. scolymus TaxID=59895 RepID=UPI000D630670|nr:probable disease resistance protein At4g19060 [Cynara cardunculus var. scolymus]
MAQVNDDDDDDEIEQHLLDRIKHAIDDQGENKNLVIKFGPVKSEFDDLWKILVERRNQTHGDDWLRMRRENLYCLNNLLTEWLNIKNQSSFFSKESYDSRENIKKILKKMKKKLDGDQESKPGEDSEKSRSHHQIPDHTIFERNKEEVYRWSSRYPPRKVHGFEHIAMAVERDLVMRNIDAPYKVFGVVGVAGIGKTTLCQTIFGRSLVKNHFSPRIWVCLSKQHRNNEPNKEIVVRILESLGIEDEVIRDVADGTDSLRRLILLLRLHLIGKRYLIVLDDAWDHNNFFLNLTGKPQLDDNWGEELAYALPKGCGGTIISSSRSEALLKEMIGKDANLQHLKPNTDEIIYEIFKDTVIGYDEDEREFPQHLIDLKKEILRKCEGIPLAAKLLAKIAREELKVKPQPLPATTAGEGDDENRPVSSGGSKQLKGGGTGVKDGERKGDVLQKSKHQNGLVPAA